MLLEHLQITRVGRLACLGRQVEPEPIYTQVGHDRFPKPFSLPHPTNCPECASLPLPSTGQRAGSAFTEPFKQIEKTHVTCWLFGFTDSKKAIWTFPRLLVCYMERCCHMWSLWIDKRHQSHVYTQSSSFSGVIGVLPGWIKRVMDL